MKRFRFWGILLLIPALAALTAVPGCGGKDKDKKPVAGDSEKKDDGKKDDKAADASVGTQKPPGVQGAKTALEPKGTGTIKGKVTYDGDPPKPKSLEDSIKEKVKDPKDQQVCLMTKIDPTWIVGADKGVKNAVVWLRPAPDKYFKIPAGEIDKVKDK